MPQSKYLSKQAYVYPHLDLKIKKSIILSTPKAQQLVSELKKQLSDEEDKTSLDKIITIHLKDTHESYQEIHALLNFIYEQLTTRGKELNNNLKTAIAEKLAKGAAGCTPGFHNRLVEALLALQTKFTLKNTLFAIRVSIIQRAANTVTTDIHGHNGFFLFAENEGYGVFGNKKDKYSWFESSSISGIVDSSMDEHYQPLGILRQVMDSLKGELSSEYGYKGKKSYKIGYSYEHYKTWVEAIESYLDVEIENWENILDIRKDKLEIARDIRWPNLNYFVFQQLVKRYFVLPRKQLEILDYLLNIAQKIDEKQKLEILFIPPRQNQPALINSHQAFLDFLEMTPKNKQSQLLDNYLRHLEKNCPKEENLFLSAFFAWSKANKLFIHSGYIESLSIKKLASICPTRLDKFNEITAYLKQYKHINIQNLLSHLINTIKEIDKKVEAIVEAYSQTEDKSLKNLLKNLLEPYKSYLLNLTPHHDKKNSNLELIVKGLHLLNPDEQRSVLIKAKSKVEKKKYHLIGYNLLMMVTQFKHFLLPKIIPFIVKLKKKDQLAILKQSTKRKEFNADYLSLMDRSVHNQHVLYLVLDHAPEYVSLFISLIEKLAPKDQLSLFNQNRYFMKLTRSWKHRLRSRGSGFIPKKNGNVLHHIYNKTYKKTLPPVLQALSKLPEEYQMAIFKHQNYYEHNVLIAYYATPGALKMILETISKLENHNQKNLLKYLLTDKNHDGFNALTRSSFDFESLKLIYQAIGKLDEKDKVHILTQEGKQGENIINYAAQKPDSFKFRLDIVKDIDLKHQKSLLTKPVHGEKFHEVHVLEELLKFEDINSLKKYVKALKVLSEEKIFDILKLNLDHRGYRKRNVFDLASRRSIDSLPILLDLISKLSPTIQAYFFLGEDLELTYAYTKYPSLLINKVYLSNSCAPDLINFIKNSTMSVQTKADILKQRTKTKEKENALTLAVLYNTNSIMPLLQLMSQLDKTDQYELLMGTMKNANNSFVPSSFWEFCISEPERFTLLKKLLNQFNEEERGKLFTSFPETIKKLLKKALSKEKFQQRSLHKAILNWHKKMIHKVYTTKRLSISQIHNDFDEDKKVLFLKSVSILPIDKQKQCFESVFPTQFLNQKQRLSSDLFHVVSAYQLCKKASLRFDIDYLLKHLPQSPYLLSLFADDKIKNHPFIKEMRDIGKIGYNEGTPIYYRKPFDFFQKEIRLFKKTDEYKKLKVYSDRILFPINKENILSKIKAYASEKQALLDKLKVKEDGNAPRLFGKKDKARRLRLSNKINASKKLIMQLNNPSEKIEYSKGEEKALNHGRLKTYNEQLSKLLELKTLTTKNIKQDQKPHNEKEKLTVSPRG